MFIIISHTTRTLPLFIMTHDQESATIIPILTDEGTKAYTVSVIYLPKDTELGTGATHT